MPDSKTDKQAAQTKQQDELLAIRMNQIKHKIAIMSGKGGVGKSTVTANLAAVLAQQGFKTAILDADIHGSCIPKMLGVEGAQLAAGPPGIFPATGPQDIALISINFFLPGGDTPVIWRGPMKMAAIKQFLTDVVWGPRDFLLVDLPPGTGDEPLSIMQLIPQFDGVVIVTAPTEVSQLVVRKAINMVKQLKTQVLGMIENMSGFVCPKCGEVTPIFGSGGGQRTAEQMGIRLLGQLPIDPLVSQDCDSGQPYVLAHPNTPLAEEFKKIVENLKNLIQQSSTP